MPEIRVVENDDVRCVQVTPSGDVANLPESPTATYKLVVFEATAKISVDPNDDVRAVHVDAVVDVDVEIFPEAPTATHI